MAATLILPFAAQPLRTSLRAGGVLRARTTVMTLLTVDCKASTIGTVQRSFCICRNVCFKDLQLQLNSVTGVRAYGHVVVNRVTKGLWLPMRYAVSRD